jgi:uncharacterized lipoprotein YmbA
MKLFVVVALSVSLFACGGKTVVRSQYLLRGEAAQTGSRATGASRVGLGRVTVAAYLDQTGIVVESGTREIQPARNHHWAEPLDDGLRIYLRTELSNALGEEVGLRPGDGEGWDYVVDVFVEQFHGKMSGEAVLVAEFRIAPSTGSGKTREYRFARSCALASEGYAALVDAEAELARQLAHAIAEAVREVARK